MPDVVSHFERCVLCSRDLPCHWLLVRCCCWLAALSQVLAERDTNDDAIVCRDHLIHEMSRRLFLLSRLLYVYTFPNRDGWVGVFSCCAPLCCSGCDSICHGSRCTAVGTSAGAKEGPFALRLDQSWLLDKWCLGQRDTEIAARNNNQKCSAHRATGSHM